MLLLFTLIQFQNFTLRHTSISFLPFTSLTLPLPLPPPFLSYVLVQIHKLRQVLVAFSWYDREVGYCQGLNRLAAIALLFLDEEDSFWCLVAMVQHLLPSDYYSKALLGSQTDQRVLKELLDGRWHRLSQHLANCE